jgi:enterochelin esterase family protein
MRRLFAFPLLAATLAAAVVAAPQQSRSKAKAPAVAENYPVHPETQPHDGVPKGTVTKQPEWKSEVFPGTVRDWWVYVPAQYKPDGPPAALMVFQDGESYTKGALNVPVVFDNLIHHGDMPVTVGVFVNPGDIPKDGKRNPKPSNRSFEYDTLSDQYVRFLLTEILPAAEKQAHGKFRAEPAFRAIGGRSSGGICAWTAAWERPDQFGKVWSAVGSFQNIRGGDRYPGIIRKTPTKPIRMAFQDGEHDLDNEHGNWWLGNLQMEAALKYKGYDHLFIRGVGQHNSKHEAAVLPDGLKWLWRDWK